MRRLLEKLRCWIIHKLGGFTKERQPDVIRRYEVNVTPMVCQAYYRITDWWQYTGHQARMMTWCQERLAVEIANELLRTGAIVIESEKRYTVPDEIVLRGRVFVVPGKTAALYMNRPMFEGRD